MSFVHLIFFLASNVICGDGAKILAVFPVLSISHQIAFRPLTQELARRGHEVVVITTHPAFPKGQTPANLTEIDVNDVSYKKWGAAFSSINKQDDPISQSNSYLDLIPIVMETQILSKDVQNMIKNNKTFDVILTQSCARPALAFSIIYKVPVIFFSSLGAVFDDFEDIGASSHPVLYPTFINQRIFNLTLWEKIGNVFEKVKIDKIYKAHEVVDNEMFVRIFGPEAPTVEELRDNVHMLILNVQPMWEGNYPVPPALKYMGGLHSRPQKVLPGDLQTFLDSSQNGVIYMSFGSNVQPSSLPSEIIQIFIKVFSELPYNILWKWDKDELPGKTNNIRIGKWFPQSDILKHPKIKLFITQAGLQSTHEAISAEVPLIGIPMRMDQWYNVEKYVIHGIGARLDLLSITEGLFRDSIINVINDLRYKKNIARLNSLLRDQPQSPLERAVWWTEHVLRHSGAAHLRAPAANISWAEYFEFELLFLLLLFICLLLFTINHCFIENLFIFLYVIMS